MPAQVVFISGCSSGFGLLTAVRAAAAGHRVHATMRDLAHRDALDAAASAAGVSLAVHQLDVTSAASIAECVDDVHRIAGQIDVLVNNAGFGVGGAIYDLSMDEIRAQFETNFFGTVALTKAVLPGMIGRRHGRIINISSINGKQAVPGLGAYSASKFALEGFTDALRMEVAPFDVDVTSVLPGMFRTEAYRKRRLAKAFGDPTSPFAQISERTLQQIDSLFETRAGDPAVVADTVLRVIDSSWPPARVIVGRDAHIQRIARRLLPESWWGWVMREAIGFNPRDA